MAALFAITFIGDLMGRRKEMLSDRATPFDQFGSSSTKVPGLQRTNFFWIKKKKKKPTNLNFNSTDGREELQGGHEKCQRHGKRAVSYFTSFQCRSVG